MEILKFTFLNIAVSETEEIDEKEGHLTGIGVEWADPYDHEADRKRQGQKSDVWDPSSPPGLGSIRDVTRQRIIDSIPDRIDGHANAKESRGQLEDVHIVYRRECVEALHR